MQLYSIKKSSKKAMKLIFNVVLSGLNFLCNGFLQASALLDLAYGILASQAFMNLVTRNYLCIRRIMFTKDMSLYRPVRPKYHRQGRSEAEAW